MRRRTQAKKLQHVSDILRSVLQKKGIPLNLENQRMARAWDSAVGPRIAAQTRPDTIRRGILFVRVSNSVWMQQLHYLKQEIIEKVNRTLGEEVIGNLFFTIGDVSLRRPSRADATPTPQVRPLREREKKMVEEWIASVTDAELRDIMRRMVTKGITRRMLLKDPKDPS